MPVIVTLLRGVNVGGHHKIKMDDLRALYESLGYRHAQTFIQSGNVICSVTARELPRVCQRIQKAIEEKYGFSCDVVARTTHELRQVLACNPFADRPGLEPARLLINFLSCDPDTEGCAKVATLQYEPDEMHIDGRHAYIYFVSGMARPKLQWPVVARHLKTSATGRNLTTVQKLLALAEQLESSR
jgi:uncharacterized protein (DUF1697 family)